MLMILICLISLVFLLPYFFYKMSSALKAKSDPSPITDSGSPDGPSEKSKSTSKIPKLKAPTAKNRPNSSPKLHALGKIPQYILKLRPKSSSSKDSTNKKVECPPDEGIALEKSGNVEINQELAENQKEEEEEIVIKTTNLEGDVPSNKTMSMKKQEVIDELNHYLQAVGISPASDSEHTIAKLRRELAESSAALVENRRLTLKIEALERKLDRGEELVKEKDQRIIKLQQESLGLSDRVRELRKLMTSIQQDLAAKDRLIAEKDSEISKLKSTEEERKDAEEEEKPQEEEENTKSELIVPLETGKPEDGLVKIRKRMLNMITATKEKFQERCKELEKVHNEEQRRFDETFAEMAEGQRQCYQEEEKIKSMIRYNHRLKAHRTKLCKVLKQHMEENTLLTSVTYSNQPDIRQFIKETMSAEENAEVIQDSSTDIEYFGVGKSWP